MSKPTTFNGIPVGTWDRTRDNTLLREVEPYGLVVVCDRATLEPTDIRQLAPWVDIFTYDSAGRNAVDRAFARVHQLWRVT